MNQLLGMAGITRGREFLLIYLSSFLGCLIISATTMRVCPADIALPKFFSDHMVLQQQANFPVWGVAEPNQTLVVRFNGSEVLATADASGKFSTFIQTPSAGGPYRLEVCDAKNKIGVIHDDVMVGEVWLCAGQSNMSWPVEKSEDAAAEILSANNYNQIRLYTVKPHADDVPLEDVAKASSWAICSAGNVKEFSAVAYFFGRDLAKTLDGTPIGLIDASWSGTRCEAWCSLESQKTVDDLSPLLDYWADIKTSNDRNRPGNLFNGMISPLVRYPLKGVLWYQGESNVGRGKQYATLLPTLIADWRQKFGNPRLPFYYAQLAPHRYLNFPTEALPEIWDAQLKTAKTVANVDMAITMDLGSITQLHPKNKQDVGKRLAILALTDTYLSKPAVTAVNGPMYESMTINKNVARVYFDYAGDGLKNLSESESIETFLVCGSDKIFHPAAVKEIGDNWVDIFSPKVPSPAAVRYCWDDTAVSLLGNSAGLPAFPFRTDDFRLSSADAKF